MKIAVRILLLHAAVFIAVPSQAQEISPFATFKGDYLKHGTVKISENGTPTASGKAKMRFAIATTGARARLTISGTVKFRGATRTFSAAYVFKPENIAAFSNLAPALDNGHNADGGAYTISPRKITADVPFVFGTTTGTGTLRLRLKKRPRGTQLIVDYTLSTNTLTSPIVWKFQGLSVR